MFRHKGQVVKFSPQVTRSFFSFSQYSFTLDASQNKINLIFRARLHRNQTTSERLQKKFFHS